MKKKIIITYDDTIDIKTLFEILSGFEPNFSIDTIKSSWFFKIAALKIQTHSGTIKYVVEDKRK